MAKKKEETPPHEVYKCDECLAKMDRHEIGRVDPLKSHPNDPNILQCPHCGKKFAKP